MKVPQFRGHLKKFSGWVLLKEAKEFNEEIMSGDVKAAINDLKVESVLNQTVLGFGSTNISLNK